MRRMPFKQPESNHQLTEWIEHEKEL